MQVTYNSTGTGVLSIATTHYRNPGAHEIRLR